MLEPGITAWAAGQFLQLGQHPFSGHLGQGSAVAADQRSGGALQAEIQLGGQPRSAQEPQRISQQVGFAEGPQLALGEIIEATRGIQQGRLGSERQRQGIDAVIAPLQIAAQIRPLLGGKIQAPGAQHQPGHVPLAIEHNSGAPVLLRQALAELDGPLRNHQIQIWIGPQPLQQPIANRSAHQGAARRKTARCQRPTLRLEGSPGLLGSLRSGEGMHHLILAAAQFPSTAVLRGDVHLC